MSSSISSPQFYVYVLARPNGKPFYVGKGRCRRIHDHELEAKTGHQCHKCNVIRKIWKQGGQVHRYVMLQTDDELEALAYEVDLIAMYGRETLVNQTDGGQGVARTPESVMKISAWQRQRFQDPTEREKTAEYAKLRWSDPEEHKKQSETVKAYWSDPETHARRAIQNREVAQTPEHRAKMSAVMKASWARRRAEKEANP